VGITIHYRGYIKDQEARIKCIELIKGFGIKRQWPFQVLEEKNDVTLDRFFEDENGDLQEWIYQGPVDGVILNPHENCEALKFEFDDDLFFQGYVKTQFSPLEIHVEILQVFNLIRPYLKELVILDEGEYWETEDALLLAKNAENNLNSILNAIENDDSLEGPVWLSSGRIADIVRKEPSSD